MANYFQEFPSTFQIMYFLADRRLFDTSEDGKLVRSIITRGPIKTRSRDGLEMYMSLSFQFRLTPEAVQPLYEILGNHLYQDEFVRFARKSIVHTTSLFNATAFFKHRAEITQSMFDRMAEDFNFKSGDDTVKVTIEGLQLREVDLPDEFDREIAETQREMQEVDVAIARRREQEKIAERDVKVTERAAKQQLTEAEGLAEKVTLENQAIVDLMLIYQEIQAQANAKILHSFVHDSDPYDRLLETMQVRAISVHDGESMVLKV
jgi:hypothetical protein